jgi:hypothetical protein
VTLVIDQGSTATATVSHANDRGSVGAGSAAVSRVVVALIAAVLAVTGCAGGGLDASSDGVPAATAQLTAEQVVTELVKRIPTVKPGAVFTAETDPNRLLGRPNGYRSKASFTDTRIPAEDVTGTSEGAVERGGSVEVFADEQGAQRRMQFIQNIASGFPAAVEYNYTSGPVLLRVARSLTPVQAAEYQKALAEIS